MIAQSIFWKQPEMFFQVNQLAWIQLHMYFIFDNTTKPKCKQEVTTAAVKAWHQSDPRRETASGDV